MCRSRCLGDMRRRADCREAARRLAHCSQPLRVVAAIRSWRACTILATSSHWFGADKPRLAVVLSHMVGTGSTGAPTRVAAPVLECHRRFRYDRRRARTTAGGRPVAPTATTRPTRRRARGGLDVARQVVDLGVERSVTASPDPHRAYGRRKSCPRAGAANRCGRHPGVEQTRESSCSRWAGMRIDRGPSPMASARTISRRVSLQAAALTVGVTRSRVGRRVCGSGQTGAHHAAPRRAAES